MSPSQFRSLLVDLEKINVLKLTITGGEPLLRKDLHTLLMILGRFDFVKSLNTNGTLVNKENTRWISDVGFHHVGVSLDAPNNLIYAKNRKLTDGLDRAVNGIVLMKDAGIPVHASITLTRHNIEHIPEIIRLAADLGIDLVGLQFICPSTYRGQEIMPYFEQWEKALLEMTDLKLAGDLPCAVSFNPPNESAIFWELYLPFFRQGRLDDLKNAWGIDPESYSPQTHVSCQAGKLTCAIAANGDVYPCEMYINWPSQKVGNAFESGIAQIWRKIFVTQADLPKSDLEGVCGTCEHDYCGGGCRASAFYFTGSTKGADLRCPITQNND